MFALGVRGIDIIFIKNLTIGAKCQIDLTTHFVKGGAQDVTLVANIFKQNECVAGIDDTGSINNPEIC